MPRSWDGGEYSSQFGKVSGGFVPPSETIVETSPDKRRSSSRVNAYDLGTESIWLLEVRGLGVISMRATSDAAGIYTFNGLSTFTDQMLQFGLEAEQHNP